MPLCPVGHESAADDYCDSCGRRVGAPAAPAAPAAASPAGEPVRGEPAGRGPAQSSCPVCRTPRSGRFCEVCRFDFATGVPALALALVALLVTSSSEMSLADATLVWSGTGAAFVCAAV